MKLTNVQERAVKEIVEHYNDGVREVQFTAPTGSGKTFMIANVISDIIGESSNKQLIFVIMTLSSAELPKQFENKLKEYQDTLVNKFNVKYWESPSNGKNIKGMKDCQIKFENKDVLIFGTSSFGKNRIFSELNRFKDFIDEAKNECYKIVYIRDEAHIGDSTNINKEDKISEQKYINEKADFIIKMTATPDLKHNYKHVFIYEKELNDQNDDRYLLKNKPHFNLEFETNDIDDEIILDTAIKQFKKVKQKYIEHYKKISKIKHLINPAMLIQISSKNQDKKIVNENGDGINLITKKLDAAGLSWVIYLDKRKESSLKESQSRKNIDLKNISKVNSNIDVVIFKIGPATGWDIPRACMLVQLRKVCSDKLSQQTIGRIKRNPLSTLEKVDLFMEYWVYSNHQEKTREAHKYVLQNKFKNVKFPSIIAIDKDKYESDEEYQLFYNNKLKPYIKKEIKNIKNYYEDFFIINTQNFIVVDSIKYKSNESISGNYEKKLKSLLDIKIYCYDILNKNKWLNKIDLNDLYNLVKQKIKNISYDQFLFIFVKEYLNKININKSEFFNHEPKFRIEFNNTLPNEYIIYKNKADIHIDFEPIENIYGYHLALFKNDELKTIQYLDSKPESVWLSHLINGLEYSKSKDKFEIIAKNPLQSNIYCEYWSSEECKYLKAYIDFIIKFKNKDQYYYIEIKSKDDDYNSKKTADIIKEFNNYHYSIEGKKVALTISLAKIDTINDAYITKAIDDNNEGKTVNIGIKKDKSIKGLKDLIIRYGK